MVSLTPPHTIRPWPLTRSNSPRIQAFLHTVTEHPDAADDALKVLLDGGTPLIEPAEDPQHSRVTFLWIGSAETIPYGVVLIANRITDTIDYSDTLLDQLWEGPTSEYTRTQVHALTLILPADWIGSYYFSVLTEPLPQPILHHGVLRSLTQLIAAGTRSDPHATHTCYEKRTNTLQAIGQCPDAPTLRLDHTTPHTTTYTRTTTITGSNNAQLALTIYENPKAEATLCLLDGDDWVTHFPILPELTRRMRDGLIPPINILALSSGGSLQRRADYMGADSTLRGLLERTMRAAHLPQTPWVLAGQSLGGLAALRAATHFPNYVAAAIAQSPSLWWPGVNEYGIRVNDWAEQRVARVEKHEPTSPILLQYGTFEWLLAENVRHAAHILRVEGSLIDLHAVHGGHDIIWWQAYLPDAVQRTLEYLGVPSRSAQE